MTIQKSVNSSPRDMSGTQIERSFTTERQDSAARRTLAAMTVRLMPGDTDADHQWRALQLREILDMLGLASQGETPSS
jgi:hypothetical protein